VQGRLHVERHGPRRLQRSWWSPESLGRLIFLLGTGRLAAGLEHFVERLRLESQRADYL
jgi:hypothetical protein